MKNFKLANEAKRKKDFNLALEHYQKVIHEKGISVPLLQGIANIFFLQRHRDEAVAYSLAAAHLALHIDNEAWKQKEPRIVNIIKETPNKLVKQFPHPIGTLLLHDKTIARHIGHTVLDQELVFEKSPEFRPYAEIYYANMLEDGSLKKALKKHKLTEQEVLQFDDERYLPYGYQILIEELKWDQLDETNVPKLYIHG